MISATLALALIPCAPMQGGQAVLSLSETDRYQEPTRLVLKTLDWDSRNGMPSVPAALAYTKAEAGAAEYYFLQYPAGLGAAFRERVRGLGGQVFDYLPHNAIEVRLPAGAVDAIRSDAQILVPVHPGYKIDPEVGLYGTQEGDPQGRMLVAVEFWPDRDLVAEQAALQAIDVQVEGVYDSGRYLRAEVRASEQQVLAISRLPGVKFLQESVTATLRNNKSEWVIQTNVSGDTKLWDAGITGKDVYIGHIDGKIHEDSCFFDDPAGVAVGPSHRKIKWWLAGGGSDTHGTHTAGSAAGNRTPVDGGTIYNGMAPDAFLVHHDTFPGSSQMLTYLNRAHGNGGRIHTNSWGNDFTTNYDMWCRDIDAYSHDNEDGVCMWAVTNQSNLKNPENAKSTVAVAATDRSNPNNFATGGRGPTADGRRKPEVFAPGCSTFSANVSSCGQTTLCGTSMACPVVAGGAALLKQYFEDGFYPTGAPNAANSFTPSGSLLRAALANSAVNMSGISGYTGNQEGYGRILLDNVAYLAGDGRQLRLVDVPHSNGLTTGVNRTVSVNIPAGSPELRVTLCWADEPGAAFAADPVVNDLNLLARAPDGTIYHGNIESNTDGAATPNPSTQNTKDSLEMIIVYNPLPGKWYFQAEGKDIPVGPQGFAGVLTY